MHAAFPLRSVVSMALSGATVLLLIHPGHLSIGVAQDKEKPDRGDALAKEAAERFMRVVANGEGAEAGVKTVAMPFFLAGPRYEGQILKDKEKVEKLFEEPAPKDVETKVTVHHFYKTGAAEPSAIL